MAEQRHFRRSATGVLPGEAKSGDAATVQPQQAPAAAKTTPGGAPLGKMTLLRTTTLLPVKTLEAM